LDDRVRGVGVEREKKVGVGKERKQLKIEVGELYILLETQLHNGERRPIRLTTWKNHEEGKGDHQFKPMTLRAPVTLFFF